MFLKATIEGILQMIIFIKETLNETKSPNYKR